MKKKKWMMLVTGILLTTLLLPSQALAARTDAEPTAARTEAGMPGQTEETTSGPEDSEQAAEDEDRQKPDTKPETAPGGDGGQETDVEPEAAPETEIKPEAPLGNVGLPGEDQVGEEEPGAELTEPTPEEIPEEEPSGEAKNGWLKENDGWFYYTDNVPAVGWQVIDHCTYYFDENGVMASDFTKVAGKWYYFGHADDGAMKKDTWRTVRNCTYHFDENGVMASDFVKIDGKWYYFGHADDGAMKKNTWRTVRNCTYHFDENGVMASDFKKIGGSWYYFGHADDGAMKRDTWRVVRNCTYHFDADGVMAADFVKIDGSWYYFGKADDGAMKKNCWRVIRNCTYYFHGDGAMAYDFVEIGGKTYYFGHADDGAMKKNCSRVIRGKTYYFDANGVMSETPPRDTKLIAIDPGHQRYQNLTREPIGPGSSQTKAKATAGTYGNASKLNEYELTLTVSLKLRDELIKRGYEVYMTRESHDVNISNAERAVMAAEAGADILVRIHANSFHMSSVHGALTMAPKANNPFLTKSVIAWSQVLSEKVIDRFCKATGAKNGGVTQTNDMSGINWSTIPVTIVEMGYMSNRSEDLKMASSSYQDKMVRGIADGIDYYYGR